MVTQRYKGYTSCPLCHWLGPPNIPFSDFCEFYSTFHSGKPHKYGLIQPHGSHFRVNRYYYPHFGAQEDKIHRNSEPGCRASRPCSGTTGRTGNVHLLTLLSPLNSAALQVQAEKNIVRNEYVWHFNWLIVPKLLHRFILCLASEIKVFIPLNSLPNTPVVNSS